MVSTLAREPRFQCGCSFASFLFDAFNERRVFEVRGRSAGKGSSAQRSCIDGVISGIPGVRRCEYHLSKALFKGATESWREINKRLPGRPRECSNCIYVL